MPLDAPPPLTRPLDRPLRVLALGASDVVGVGASHPEREGWAPTLVRMLPGKVSLMRLGISGARAAELRAQLLPRAIAAPPDVAIVWTGVNDCIGQVPVARFTADLDAIVRGLVGVGARVYAMNLPDVHRLPAFRAYALPIRLVVGRWQGAVREVAARHGASAIELGLYSDELAAHPEYLSRDGFHPSTAGHRRIAEIVASSLAP